MFLLVLYIRKRIRIITRAFQRKRPSSGFFFISFGHSLQVLNTHARQFDSVACILQQKQCFSPTQSPSERKYASSLNFYLNLKMEQRNAAVPSPL